MTLCVKKEEFLRNKENKQRFIDMLGRRFEQCGCHVVNASGDADVLIVKTAVAATHKYETVLIGDDTDLLVVMCYYHPRNAVHNLFFLPEPKKG
jgi:hypothetical protein